jgi:uncharacterized membrane protein
MRPYVAALFLVLVLTLPSSHAPAATAPGNLQLCNHYPHPVLFALGWSANGTFYSRGWWTVGSGHCTNVALPVTAFYWYASTEKFADGNGNMGYTWWAGKAKKFCISTNDFYFNHADGPCGKNTRVGSIASFARTDGVPIYQTVTIDQNGGSGQSVGPGHSESFSMP